MLSVSDRRKLQIEFARNEGAISHMYLDSKGYVTVGVGHLLKSVGDAQKVAFLDNKTKKKATADEIKIDYENVKKQPKNRVASFYKSHTKLFLDRLTIDTLTNEHIDKFYNDLKIIYPNFDSYPEEVRLALFDLIFNVGKEGLRSTWPTFNAAIKAKDWKKAADNSSRASPVAPSRNKYVKDLLEKASKNDSKPKKP